MLKLFCKKVFRNQSSLFHPHELYLGKRYEASGKGLSNPNFKKICKGFGVRYSEIKKNKDIEKIVKKIKTQNYKITNEERQGILTSHSYM